MIIGVSGDVASFSEAAGKLYARNADIKEYTLSYLIDMEGVLLNLSQGNIDLGVFPVVNNNSGLVRPAFEAMGRYNFAVLDEVHLDVSQCLLVKQHMPLDKIKSIYSYTPAFIQCKNFLNNMVKGIPIVDWGDTAKAARDLASGVIADDCAVIASKQAGLFYGLEIQQQSIQDVNPNITMFIVVGR